MKRKVYSRGGEYWHDMGPGRSLARHAAWYRRLEWLTRQSELGKFWEDNRRVPSAPFELKVVRCVPFYYCARCKDSGLVVDGSGRTRGCACRSM